MPASAAFGSYEKTENLAFPDNPALIQIVDWEFHIHYNSQFDQQAGNRAK